MDWDERQAFLHFDGAGKGGWLCMCLCVFCMRIVPTEIRMFTWLRSQARALQRTWRDCDCDCDIMSLFHFTSSNYY